MSNRPEMDIFFAEDIKEVGRGTGLGLPQAYGLVKAHGGTLFIDSEEGRGTEVRILLLDVPEPEEGWSYVRCCVGRRTIRSSCL